MLDSEEEDIDITGVSDEEEADTSFKLAKDARPKVVEHCSKRTEAKLKKLKDLVEREESLMAQIMKTKDELRMLETAGVFERGAATSPEDNDESDNKSDCLIDVEDWGLHEFQLNGDVRTFNQFEFTPAVTASIVPEHSVPINADVTTFDFESLASTTQFDVILMDPPWQLASNAPSRGVAISYSQLSDQAIQNMPVQLLQKTSGFIFIWVINTKYLQAFELLEKWGYKYCDDITWVKRTIHRRMAKGHGYYLQHAKETCIVGFKGNVNVPHDGVGSDVIYSERRGQSQKPTELYELIEKLVPNGKYLEIFGRKNNLRDYWVTIGNELC
ncbi:MT-A70-domain-containing protein [Obelidium mucronatum]|nr:MT-A70-domain-containing protein [Obelidium mucronatum]